RSSGASPTRTRTDARLSPRSDHERAPRLEPHRGALEELGVLALLRLQLAVEAPLGRGLDPGEDGELRGGRTLRGEIRRLEMVAAGEQVHVLALHRRKAIEELDDL